MIKQILDNYVFNIYTCTLLALSSKICKLCLEALLSHRLLGFVDQCVVSFTNFKVSK